jgi:homogentisate 1,2-dioxygenase
MPIYHKLGKFPHKRHIQFRKENGDLYVEQLFGTEGFSGLASLLYHTNRPTIVKSIGESKDLTPEIAYAKSLKAHRFLGFQATPVDDFLNSRIPLMVNNDVIIGVASPRKSMKDYFYKNTDADEMLFIHEGKGVLKTMVGQIPFEYGDYLVIPRGTIYQLHFHTTENRIFYTESFSPIKPPKRYMNQFGQFLEHSPYCERDLKLPENLETIDAHGDFLVYIKKGEEVFPYTYATHPFDARRPHCPLGALPPL